MKKILFIYRHNELNEVLINHQTKSFPREFMFGYDEINKLSPDFKLSYINSPRGLKKSAFDILVNYIEKRFSKTTKLGFPFDIFIRFYKQIRNADIIFCTNDAISFGVLFWKMLGLYKAKTIVLMQSLPERTKYFKKSRLIISFIKILFAKADLILTLSDIAHEALIVDYQIPQSKLKTLYFGIDTKFWKPIKTQAHNKFILSVGNDMNRDYETLINALPKDVQLTIVSRNILPFKNERLRILHNISDYKLRKLYNQASMVIIPSIKLQYESSGLSCTLQSLACHIPVICTKLPAIEEMLDEFKCCAFYEAGNIRQLNQQIIKLMKSPSTRNELVKNAQSYIMHNSYKTMAYKLNQYLHEVTS